MEFRFQSPRSENLSPGGQWAGTCSRACDAGLLGVLFLAPLFFSGRHDLGRLVFAALAALTATAWALRQAIVGRGRWRGTAAYGVLIAAIALVGLQLLPLPGDWIARLSPRVASLLPMWSGADGDVSIGAWRTLSLAPSATAVALAMLAAYSLLFVVAVQRLETHADVWRLFHWIALASLAAGAFALVQYFTANGRYFWFYRYPYYDAGFDVVGSFLNKNHLAHFVTLGVAPLLAIMVRAFRARSDAEATLSRKRPTMDTAAALAAAGLALAGFTVLLSLSRGGALGLAACLAVAIASYWRCGAIDRRLGAALAVPAVAIVALLGVYGYDRVSNRLDDLAVGSLEAIDAGGARRQIWAANVAAIRDGGLFGAGAGSHSEIYQAYLDAPTAKWFTHAENGYLQIVTENGAVGGLLLAIGLGFVAWWCLVALRKSRTLEAQLQSGAVAAALAASVVHSFVDFVWFVPACMSLTVLLAACAVRLAQLATSPQRGQAPVASKTPQNDSVPAASWSRPAWARLAIGTAGTSLAMVASLVGPGRAALTWDQYQNAAIAQIEAADRALRSPERQQANELAADNETLLRAMAHHLEEVVRVRPDSARAHQRLAKCYMQLFELCGQQADNAMPISQICDAAMASSFQSPADLRQWLGQAFGEQSALLVRAYVHARRAIELSPLIPDSYLHLAKLCFLEGRGPQYAQACVEQALRLGPFDGGVRYEAGVALGVLGDWDRANECWKIAYRTSSIHQLNIIQSAPGRIPVAAFLAALEPDWKTLRAVWAHYSTAASAEELAMLADYAEQAAIRDTAQASGRDGANIWLALGLMQRDVGRTDAALESLQRAAAADAGHYTARRTLGLTLTEANRFHDAEPHLRWCLSRRPDDRVVSDALAASLRARTWAAGTGQEDGRSRSTAARETTTRR